MLKAKSSFRLIFFLMLMFLYNFFYYYFETIKSVVFQISLFSSLCFRYEKLKTNFVSCLERSESASKRESNCLSADKTKLHTEIQDLEVHHIELSMCSPNPFPCEGMVL